ncbi:MAG: hypothetical protein COX02_00705 [Candidatus Vogelbacteria bacterium CG22_combo_CG10-13_8_21_14_all_37_9]|uniref:Uncharacterized protein n=1 Tax=Candidatus Vogelbacteria bacterium CG22_combo_CG10-13_8_21_14_all_37_9 TaxID=1975046 RepID=A0A2H0BL13_9BACT|nr:MAG: hypothetical protein BK005_02370 [bacterium CG10_37_50]PIP58362.1 MAG: hypothetical protein COX02_00705 [Candidatus Vogelbacteria bacterium CG22_combo_CG10-13_8_21_14_all_37_9]
MYLKVRVIPDSKADLIEELKADLWRIYVREPAEHNLANQKVLSLVARQKGINPSSIRIVSGHHSRSKILSIRG